MVFLFFLKGGNISDGGGRLGLLRVAGGGGRGLARERVHGAQELIRDAAGLAQPAEQGAVDCGGVISDGVLPGEEEAWDGLKGRKKKDEPEPARLVHIKNQYQLSWIPVAGVLLTCEAPGIAGPGVIGCAMRS